MTDLVQRRTVQTLVIAQAVGAVGITIGIATASLLARDVSGSEAQAGLAQTSQTLGAAVASYFIAALMASRGRRLGLLAGIGVAAVGSALCVVAGAVDSMALLLVGCALLGCMNSVSYAARYAATDLASDEHRSRDLSTVVWATTVGAVLGPNLAGPAGSMARSVGLPALTGPFLAATVGMLVAGLVIATRLRPDPLLLARERAGITSAVRTGTSWGRVRDVIRVQPAVAAGILGIAGAHSVMVGVMVMTPLHMEHGHAELHVIGFVISVHVLGMFAFSPLMGMACDRLGRSVVLGAGGAVLLLALALSGVSPMGSSWQIFLGLFLLGVGWSAAMVAGSTLVTEHTPLEVRTDVQGATDLIMGLTAAGAGGLSGVIMGELGYDWLNGFAAALSGLVLVAAVLAARPSPDRHQTTVAESEIAG